MRGGEIEQARGHARGIHQASRENEERDGQQDEVVDPGHHPLGNHGDVHPAALLDKERNETDESQGHGDGDAEHEETDEAERDDVGHCHPSGPCEGCPNVERVSRMRFPTRYQSIRRPDRKIARYT